MAWFRKSNLDPLTVTMAGVKLGDRLLVMGTGDTALIAALAAKVGLTGRACALDASESATATAARLIEREGVLVETYTAPWTMLPFDRDTFDAVVLRNVLKTLDPEARMRSAAEVHRVLRGGGRAVVIEDHGRQKFAGLVRTASDDPQYERSGGAVHVLDAAGFKATRTLAERDGQVFVEGVKAHAPGSAV
jgi:ubiquinone/menaquinone biosynthesis C-methylase UbiE